MLFRPKLKCGVRVDSRRVEIVDFSEAAERELLASFFFGHRLMTPSKTVVDLPELFRHKSQVASCVRET